MIGVRLCVHAGLLLIVLGSPAGRPFTMEYAREQVAPRVLDQCRIGPNQLRRPAVRAAAFAVMGVGELALLTVPGLPPRAGIVAIILALVGWYPEHVKLLARP